MNPMVCQLLKTFHIGSKCCVPVLLWSLAAWVLLLHAYTSLLRVPSQLPEPQSQWQMTSMMYQGAEKQSAQKLKVEMIEMVDRIAQMEVEKVGNWNKLEENVDLEETFGTAALAKPMTTAKAPEESKEALARRKLGLLFPDKSSAIDPSKVNGSEYGYFYPGQEWLDSAGRPIQAHGGGVMYVAETRTYYWYGENKDGATKYSPKQGTARVDVLGISCYSSKDLWTWHYLGLALKPERRDKSSDLYFTNVVERPKVIYNDRTKQYIMWMHIDNANYSKAAVGVAVSPNPEGPFEYVGSKRPHGCDSRDMTIFQDDDGEAYLIYSSLGNSELHIGPLTEDYMDVVERGSQKVLVKERREAPAVFKHKGMYYMVTSGCTGWAPNGALVHAAESMLGPWVTLGDPCVGGEEEFRSFTFFSQGTFVLPLPGLENTFIFMADRWRPADLRDSRYVWLPLTMDGPADEPSDDEFEFPLWLRVSIHWYGKWKLPEGWDNQHRELSSLQR